MPAHFDAEVLSGVLRAMRRREAAEEDGERALLAAARLPAERVPLKELLAQAYTLRRRCGPYDAFYLALARRSAGLLLTSDAPLARAAVGYADVELVPTDR